MRKGYEPTLVFNKQGDIIAIATGSDACAEHEGGTAPMQQLLCSGFAGKDSNMEQMLLAQLRHADQEPGLLAKLLHLSPKPVQFPDLLSQKVIDSNLDKVHFVEGEDQRLAQPAAVLWFTDRRSTPDVNYHELTIWKTEDEVAGAWNERGFAFKVVGEKLIKKLRAFAEKLKTGQGCFAGLFLNKDGSRRLGGVIIALHTELLPEHKAAVATAQADYENNMLLKSRSRLEELHAVAYPQGTREPHLKEPGYLWPVWKDNVVGGEVLYALNPDYGVKAPYWGPYSFEQLHEWIVAKDKFELVPVPRTLERATAA